MNSIINILLTNMVHDDMLLTEVLSASAIAKMKNELATPEILPCDFDVTIPGWLERIKLWGVVKIKHVDPENHWGKRKITIPKFIELLNNEDLRRMLVFFVLLKNLSL